MAIANLALRFVVELVGVAALALWGLGASTDGVLRIVLALLAPLALIVVWAFVVAPKASNPLTQVQRNVIGTALLLAAAAALAAADQSEAAIVFASVVIANQILLIAFGESAGAALRPADRPH